LLRAMLCLARNITRRGDYQIHCKLLVPSGTGLQ
jgi:hypothetical protein